jgi:hypothetical protein
MSSYKSVILSAESYGDIAESHTSQVIGSTIVSGPTRVATLGTPRGLKGLRITKSSDMVAGVHRSGDPGSSKREMTTLIESFPKEALDEVFPRPSIREVAFEIRFAPRLRVNIRDASEACNRQWNSRINSFAEMTL